MVTWVYECITYLLISLFCPFFRLLHYGIYGISNLNSIHLNHIKMKYSRYGQPLKP